MKLTAKQEAFCQAIADGKTQADAYRTAYEADAMADKTVWEKASALMADGKVRARVDQLREKLAEKALWTRQDSVEALKAVVYGAESKASEIVSAVKELNSMHGYEAPKKTDMRVSGGLVLVPSKDGWQ